jgi:hypothetical protein
MIDCTTQDIDTFSAIQSAYEEHMEATRLPNHSPGAEFGYVYAERYQENLRTVDSIVGNKQVEVKTIQHVECAASLEQMFIE